MDLWIEESHHGRGYKHVHRKGCRDVRDPEPIDVRDRAELEEIADMYGLEPVKLAPCVKGL